MARGINLDAITIEDCLDMWEKKNMAAVVDNGRVIDFIGE